jgi:hypothetical protein
VVKIGIGYTYPEISISNILFKPRDLPIPGGHHSHVNRTRRLNDGSSVVIGDIDHPGAGVL